MKIPKIRKLDSGTYFCQLRLGGESVSITAPTETECRHLAELEKAKYLAGVEKNRIINKQLTLGKIIDKYIAKYEKVLSPSTVRGYNTIRKNRFKDYMDVPLKNIKDWQRIIDDELRLSSEHTVKNAWGLVTASMAESGLPIPRVKLAKVPVKDTGFLDPDEIKLFLKAAEGDDAEIEMLLELHGLRESECMYVVRNNGIDIKKNVIRVSGALVPDKNHKFVTKATNKNATSTRTVPIMIPRLSKLVKDKQEAGESIETHSASALLSHVHKTCRRAGITDCGNHSLRKSFASLCFSQGIPDRQIQEWCGWSDYETMHRIYIRMNSADKDKNKKTVTDFFKSTTVKK